MKISVNEHTIDIYMTKNEAATCSHSGSCDRDCAEMVKRHPRMVRRIPRDVLISAFYEYGAWSLKELQAMADTELYEIAIWTAASDILDGDRGQWALIDGSYGMAHPESLRDR